VCGGGVRSVEVLERIVPLGVEKVALSAAAVRTPELIRSTAERVGYRKLFRAEIRYRYPTADGETGEHCYKRRSGQFDTPKLPRHFSPRS